MAAVTAMTCERFGDGREEIKAPTWADVERALRRMDGETWYALSLEAEHAYLALEGGVGGHFLVGWSNQSWDEHHVALAPNAGDVDELEMIEIGGETGETEARKCVELETALACVRGFFESGQRAEGATWERLP